MTGPLRILVADDERLIREPIGAALELAGYEVELAKDGPEALAAIRSGRPKLVLLDLEMPGMSGMEVLRRIGGASAPGAPRFIVLTATQDKAIVLAARGQGIRHFMLKSAFSLKELLERIKLVLDEAAGAQPCDKQDVAAPASVTPPVRAAAVDAPAVHTAALAEDEDRGEHLTQGEVNEQLRALKPLMSRDELMKRVLDGTDLRALAPSVRQVLTLTASDGASLDDIAKAIKQDQALSLKILKVANSPVYAHADRVESVQKAVGRIGVAQIRTIVQSISVIDQFSAVNLAGRVKAEWFWEQTIAYGLLSARMSRPSGITADDAALMIPNTNPFLKELMEEFLRIGGRDKAATVNGGIDFDELGVNDVVELLRRVNVTAIIADFGRERPGEDPVIHFYEYFMEVYDKEQKVSRGVFYTPRQVVSFIVRSVDEILREECGLPLGLADTTTWGEMVARFHLPEEGDNGVGSSATGAGRPFTIPPGVKPEDPFVQILDPATGTGTFLVETIDLIYTRMVEHWQNKCKKTKAQIEELWNQYVPEHLLPRLYGFELMMAPYAIAHMKIGLKLADTGYRFRSEQRLRVFLTNSLEPPTDLGEMLEFAAPFLAHEARAANAVKRVLKPTVIIGNPPYAQFSSNLFESARQLVSRYRTVGGSRVVERNALQLERNINDDYVKFFALAENMLNHHAGVLGLITNSVFLASPTLRGLRYSLLSTFQRLQFIDLRGATQRGAVGEHDENVFDIEQPVAISLLWKKLNGAADARVTLSDIRGPRTLKYATLVSESARGLPAENSFPATEMYSFRPIAGSSPEYAMFPALDKLFRCFAEGIKTGRDWLVVGDSDDDILATLREIAESDETDADLCERIGLNVKKAWDFAAARRILRRDVLNIATHCHTMMYRPFDQKRIFFHPNWIASRSWPVMQHMVSGNNLAILSGRISRDPDKVLAFCARGLVDKSVASSLDNVSAFPALLMPATGLAAGTEREANLTPVGRALAARVCPSGSVPEQATSLVHYAYAIAFCPAFRTRYREQLASEYLHVPEARDGRLALELEQLGSDLVAIHLLDGDIRGVSPRSTPRVTEV